MSPLVWGMATAAAGYIGLAAAHPAVERWGRGFHRGPRSARRVGLTFDDGPSNETERVLELLAEHGARATFFVCGANLERRPAPARRALALGHEIGNHSYGHPLLLGLSAARVREEVSRTQRIVEDRLGVSPRLFRPPYGVRSPWLPRALEAEGLLAVQWSVIGMDWKLSAARIARRVLRASEPGALICLHDGDGVRPTADRAQMVAALREILPELERRGLEAAPAGELWRPQTADGKSR